MQEVYVYTINGKVTTKVLYNSKKKALEYACDEIKMYYLEDAFVSKPIRVCDTRFPTMTNRYRIIVRTPIDESYNALQIPFDEDEYIIQIHILSVI